MLCAVLLTSSLLGAGLARQPRPACAELPPVECVKEDMVRCAGPVDEFGCTGSDFCLAAGDLCPGPCPLLPPVECGDKMVPCAGPLAHHGCRGADLCVPLGDTCPDNQTSNQGLPPVATVLPPIATGLPPIFPGPIETYTRVRLELYPGLGAPVQPVAFDGKNLTLAVGSGFQPSKPLKVVIHGYRESSLVDGEVQHAGAGRYGHYGERWAAAYQAAGMDYTVLNVLWVPREGFNIFNQVPAAEDAANTVSLLLYAIARDYNMPSSNIHVMGFSLGTVVTAKAGQKTQELGMAPLGRFTLLDPCGLGATDISPSDAAYVEAIHTSSQGICTEEPLAHVDFYVNGGLAQVCGAGLGLAVTGPEPCSCTDGAAVCDLCYHGRPRCQEWGLNHERAVELYLQSISAPQGRGDSFLSWRCSLTYTEMRANDESCPWPQSGPYTALTPMGEDSTAGGRPQDGIYFLATTGEAPYSYNSYLDFQDWEA